MLSIQLILIFMIIAAIFAIEFKDMLSSVIAIGALSLSLSLLFLMLKAPDLAIILLVVEVVVLTVFVKATISTDRHYHRNSDIFTIISVLVLIGFFLFIAYFAVVDIAKFGSPYMKISKLYIASGLSKTGASNIVSAIALGFRSYDSLGGIIVLFALAIGVKSALGKSRRIK
ncbi:hydrogen gas-evolving membrane-bound hydrogenase subunit E [Elusimicrobiota bacterium]